MERKKDFLIWFGYWGVVAVCVYMALKHLLPVLFPFVLAFGIACLLNKPVKRMAGDSRWKRTFFSVRLSIVFFVMASGLADVV